MHRCPVCLMECDGSEITAQWHETTYVLCSWECRSDFQSSPWIYSGEQMPGNYREIAE